MKHKKIILLMTAIGSAYAGQTINDRFGIDQSRFKSNGTAIAVDWLDAKNNVVGVNQSLQVVQSESEQYKLYTYRKDGGSDLPVNLELGVEDFEFMPVIDPFIRVENGSTTCSFLSGDFYCKFNLFAVNESTVGAARRAYFEPDGSTSANADDRVVQINEYTDGGTIEGDGPDNVPNRMTAIAVSENPGDDNVAFTVKVKNAVHVGKVHIQYDVVSEGKTIVDFLPPETKTCDLTFIPGQTEGTCPPAQLTPYKVGHTIIQFESNNSWWSTESAPTEEHKYTNLPEVKVSVGSLYAGYENGKVLRKGSSSPVSQANVVSLAVDGAGHKLYAISKDKIYQQNNFSEANLNVLEQATLPAIGGRAQLAQTLSLTNKENELLVGTAKYKIYSFISGESSVSEDHALTGSIASASTDTLLSHLNYFADMKNIFASRTESGIWTVNTEPLAPYYHDMKISSEMDRVYIAVDDSTTKQGTDLFTWQGSKLVKVEYTGVDPFQGDVYIVTMFDNGQNLYAAGNNSTLYKLDHTAQDQLEWVIVGTIPHAGMSTITDIAFDMNHNIYIASGNGVYRIKYIDTTHMQSPESLALYNEDTSTRARTVVIDNNVRN